MYVQYCNQLRHIGIGTVCWTGLATRHQVATEHPVEKLCASNNTRAGTRRHSCPRRSERSNQSRHNQLSKWLFRCPLSHQLPPFQKQACRPVLLRSMPLQTNVKFSPRTKWSSIAMRPDHFHLTSPEGPRCNTAMLAMLVVASGLMGLRILSVLMSLITYGLLCRPPTHYRRSAFKASVKTVAGFWPAAHRVLFVVLRAAAPWGVRRRRAVSHRNLSVAASSPNEFGPLLCERRPRTCRTSSWV